MLMVRWLQNCSPCDFLLFYGVSAAMIPSAFYAHFKVLEKCDGNDKILNNFLNFAKKDLRSLEVAFRKRVNVSKGDGNIIAE